MAVGLWAVCATGGWAAETDKGWPRTATTTNGNQVVIFQPQLESWKDNRLQGRAVVEITLKSEGQPHLGVAWFTADTKVDSAKRLVTLENLTITRTKFSVQAEQEPNMLAVIRAAVPNATRTIALDRLTVASVVAQSQAQRKVAGLKHDPPMVIWTTNAVAALVLVDGDPVLRPVQGSSLMRVINTAALILFDPSGGTYYLSGDGSQWFQAQAITGPWAVSPNPPASVASLTPSQSGTKASANPAGGSPVVFVSTKPAELLHTLGAPSYKTESGSGLMYIDNTDSQLFYNPDGGTAYLLLSGRWFASKGSLSGPWSHVPATNLPASFAQISPQGPKGAVLPSVPGTQQADAAQVANSAPQTATIQRSGASFEVQYDGPPQFKPIDSTTLQYAVNAAEPVILCQNAYYALANAVWFTAGAGNGPWEVATSVPEEIYSIPPSSPLYYVTYAYIGYADTNQVEAAYLPGYTGSYNDDDGPIVVYGTGWIYRPWVEHYYYGWGCTYGYGYQYRWWQRNWLWRPCWSGVGNLYAVNPLNAYDRWPRAAGGAYTVRAVNVAFEDGMGYPTMYGRFAGARRAVPMPVPARASLVNPYASWAGATRSGEDLRGAQQLTRGLRVGSTASRDLYATSDGSIYRRQDGNWYRGDAAGKWAYAAPAVPAATDNVQRPVQYTRNQANKPDVQRPVQYTRNQPNQPNVERPAQYDRSEVSAMNQEYQARAMGQRSWQQYRGGGGSRGGRR